MTTLKGLCIEELQDLWSANDQLAEVLAEMVDKAPDHTPADRSRNLAALGCRVAVSEPNSLPFI